MSAQGGRKWKLSSSSNHACWDFTSRTRLEWRFEWGDSDPTTGGDQRETAVGEVGFEEDEKKRLRKGLELMRGLDSSKRGV
mmetsp:Transcript_21400/g.36072  ORF Transcript_21400/g.36072 Transcript_21400/m.36072 type:complete len:81 (-) Transcript_21400:36-278(-)